jgi:membrane-associated phospholipid phosphatase
MYKTITNLNDDDDKKLWKPVWLLAGQLSALLLLISWLLPSSHQIWQQLDTWFFWNMNGSMVNRPDWQYIMALANHRMADLVPASLIALLYLHFCFKGINTGHFTERVTYGVTIVVFLFLTIIVFKFGIFEFLLRNFGLTDLLPRRSATYIFNNTIRLDEIFPSINSKVTSKDSFPGDHATVLIFFTVFIHFYAGRIYGGLAFLFSLIFIMPRLIGGAHWLSDVLVGGGFIVLAASSLYLATPLHKVVSDYLAKYVNSILTRLKINQKIS